MKKEWNKKKNEKLLNYLEQDLSRPYHYISRHIGLPVNNDCYTNDNTLVIGGAGEGKTMYALQNILQMHGSYIVADTCNELYNSTHEALEKNGYLVYKIDMEHPEQGNLYNPFAQLTQNKTGLYNISDIEQICKSILTVYEKRNDILWFDTMQSLLYSVIFYMLETQPLQYWNFDTVLQLIQRNRCFDKLDYSSKDNLLIKNDFHYMLLQHVKRNPNSQCKQFCKIFDLVSINTFKEIVELLHVIISTMCRNTNQKQPAICLSEILIMKVAIFIETPIGDYNNPFTAILINQAIAILYKHENQNYPIHFIIDSQVMEMSNLYRSDEVLATCGKYNIRFSYLRNSLQKQEDAIYGNIDNLLFLGSRSLSTCDEIAKLYCQSFVPRKRKKNIFRVVQKTTQQERPIITSAQLYRLPLDKCIFMKRNYGMLIDEK